LWRGADLDDAVLGTEEEAAHVPGRVLQISSRRFPPRLGLFYGVLFVPPGEFGAVSVVSGHIRGLTNTLPLHVEILYNEYRLSAAFAVASLLTGLALLTLVLKAVLEARARRERRAA
jgi:sulfate transport system permease protein